MSSKPTKADLLIEIERLNKELDQTKANFYSIDSEKKTYKGSFEREKREKKVFKDAIGEVKIAISVYKVIRYPEYAEDNSYCSCGYSHGDVKNKPEELVFINHLSNILES